VEITEVRIKLMEDSNENERLQAFCSVTFDDAFVVRDLKIIEGTKGSFVAMPSRKLTDRCPGCGCKNHLRARYCNQCGAKLDEDRSMDITRFCQKLVGPFRDAEAALLLLDHLNKPNDEPKTKKSRSRYARGSGAKLAKTHATFLIETAQPFDRENSGALRMWKTKDRRGFITLPHPKGDPLMLGVAVGDGQVRFEPGNWTPPPAYEGPTRCMEAILAVMPASTWLSTNQVGNLVKYGRNTVQDALKTMAEEGTLAWRPGPRSSVEYSLPDAEPQEMF